MTVSKVDVLVQEVEPEAETNEDGDGDGDIPTVNPHEQMPMR